MVNVATLPIMADRYGALVRQIYIEGLDLTGVQMRAQVRLGGDVPGAPLVDLLTVSNGNAQGLRLVSVEVENGLPTSHIEMVINESAMEALPYAGEIGDATTLAWDWQATIAGRKQRIAKGAFVITGDGVTGADNAPASRPIGYGQPGGAGGGMTSGATLRFGDDVVVVKIDGAALIAPLTSLAEDAADSAEAAAVTALESAVTSEGARDTVLAVAAGYGVYASKADATAAIGLIPVNGFVFVVADETRAGSRVTYRNVSGALTLAADHDGDRMIDVRRFGASRTASDNTLPIQAAIDFVEAMDLAVIVVCEFYQVKGTLVVPGGVTLVSLSAASEYYPNSPFSSAKGAGLEKPTNGLNGPLIEVRSGGAAVGLYLRHRKVGGATTGIVRMGGATNTDVCYYATVRGCRIYGHAIDDAGAFTGSGCHGVHFPDSDLATSKQRYFNHVDANIVTNCDEAIRLGGQSNANRITGNQTRQCYRHYVLDGGTSECVDNIIDGAQLANINYLPGTAPVVCFTLKKAVHNAFAGYTTECLGAAFDIEAETCSNNYFLGAENEIASSYVPLGNYHSRYAQPINRDQTSQMLLPNSFIGTRNEQGQGNKITRFSLVPGPLPQLNGSGAMASSDPNCKRIITFNAAVYTKAAKSSFAAKLRLFVCASGGGGGEHLVEVDFAYRVTDLATDAGELMVQRVWKGPSASYVAGLYFLASAGTSGTFAVAMVGGNFGTSAATHVAAELEITALTHTTNTIAMADFAEIVFASAPVTDAEIATARSLLAETTYPI